MNVDFEVRWWTRGAGNKLIEHKGHQIAILGAGPFVAEEGYPQNDRAVILENTANDPGSIDAGVRYKIVDLDQVEVLGRWVSETLAMPTQRQLQKEEV